MENIKNYSHAYIICGPDAGILSEKALSLSKAIVCSGSGTRPCGACENCRKAAEGIHPDIITLQKPEGKRMITVDQIRDIRSDVYTLPNEASQKVYIVKDADTMNPSAQNAFLKILEEPPAYAHFILTAENQGELLPTVRSRCVTVPVTPKKGSDTSGDSGPAKEAADAFGILSGGSRVQLLELSSLIEHMSPADADTFFRALKATAAKALRTDSATASENTMKIIEESDTALKYLGANVSPVHIAGHVAATFIK